MWQAWTAQNVRYEDVGADRCRVTLTGEVCMAVPGLGALVERVIVHTVTAALQLLPCLVRPCCSRARDTAWLGFALQAAADAPPETDALSLMPLHKGSCTWICKHCIKPKAVLPACGRQS